MANAVDRAVRAQGGTVVKPHQVKAMVLAARRAYKVQSDAGLVDDGVDFDSWRRATLHDVVGAAAPDSFRAVTQRDYAAVLGYFMELAGEDGALGDRALPTVGADHRAARSFEEFATLLLDEARFMHNAGKWFLSLMLVMPDHLHLIVHGPPGGRPLPLVIGDFKRYLTSHFGIRFQRDFFDTRIRDDAHYAEKFRYICNNPVRKGLCVTARNWRHVIAFDRNTGMERQHR